MVYAVTPNQSGGLHVMDTETLVHGEVASAEEAKEWFEAQDAAKLAEWEARNAQPKPGEMPANDGAPVVAADVTMSRAN